MIFGSSAFITFESLVADPRPANGTTAAARSGRQRQTPATNWPASVAKPGSSSFRPPPAARTSAGAASEAAAAARAPPQSTGEPLRRPRTGRKRVCFFRLFCLFFLLFCARVCLSSRRVCSRIERNQIESNRRSAGNIFIGNFALSFVSFRWSSLCCFSWPANCVACLRQPAPTQRHQSCASSATTPRLKLETCR